MPLFCDFDGPIINVSDRYYSTYRLGLARTRQHYSQMQGQPLLLRPMTKAQFWCMKQERVPDEEIAFRSGLQEDQVTHFLQEVRQQVNHPSLLLQDQLQPGVPWALSLLQQEGFRLILVTLRCQHQVVEILERYQLSHYFEGIYGVNDAGIAYDNQVNLKTRLLRQALAHHCSTKTNMAGWMIGDTEADVLAAQTLGIPSVALTCGIRSLAYLNKLEPDCIHSSLLMLAHHLSGCATSHAQG
jgi:phosphoglycolate phosphatase-like HAD superfamily hydrolase